MTRGRKPTPTVIRRAQGNPGKRGYNHAEPEPPEGCPDCPSHLSEAAQQEWHRLATGLHEMGVLTIVDRAALAAYCQAYGRWVEAEERLKETPTLVKTPSGYVQQNPWLSVSNKQLELMSRFMAELGLTPASRSRVAAFDRQLGADPYSTGVLRVERVVISRDADGNLVETMLDPPGRPGQAPVRRIELDTRL